ncbi:hypothetical protein [Thermoproteus tenax]|uniref:Uncharacterized protein n=1 Tax=Thermoproteus tenax (strain ATCC 35583 / DSM 2078 / JCM 9277 / NBRC 100435 / Kra 1) TaxID=768679 RepID=G4RPZ0_THETK|nr:hypothetical protein [Thermoproteus tenax]CCC81635.1 hypothetical protein TTX_0987 [Thermoproteus tenax Kra 1]
MGRPRLRASWRTGEGHCGYTAIGGPAGMLREAASEVYAGCPKYAAYEGLSEYRADVWGRRRPPQRPGEALAGRWIGLYVEGGRSTSTPRGIEACRPAPCPMSSRRRYLGCR